MSFAERHPEAYQSMALAIKDYATYVTEMETGVVPEGAAAGTSRPRPRIDLEHDSARFPIIPEVPEDEETEGLEHQKRVIRSFLTDHYRACRALRTFDVKACVLRLK
jgi:hypothetical protein